MSKSSHNTVMGKVTSVYGVKGWVKVFSYTQPKENLCQYIDWQLQDQSGVSRPVKVLDCKPHGNGLVALFDGARDRDIAKNFCGMLITVPSSELPSLSEGEYYWSDLEGLEVHTIKGEKLGRVERLMETGANDVLVIRGDKEHLVPFIQGRYVKRVSLSDGLIEVDWDADF